jgi:urease accessory protein
LTSRVVAVRRAGDWRQAERLGEVAFDYDRRYRRRMRFAAAGLEVFLDLPEAVHARDGDAYALEGGGFIEVRAAPEAILEVAVADADRLARLAWHLGNRHLAVQFLPGRLRLLDDHVIAEMITQLGGKVERLMAAFDPEPGAYQHG